MRRSLLALTLTSALAGACLLAGCRSEGDGVPPGPKVIEHTTSTPPPGIVERQKQQSQTTEQSAKTQLPKPP